MLESRVVVDQFGSSSWQISLLGEHDLSTLPQIRNVLDQVFSQGTNIVIDLSDTTFIDSSVIAALIDAQVRANANAGEELVVVAPPGTRAADVIDLAGVRPMLRVYESRPDATDALPPPDATDGS
jgi:anti-sigma B factor antagonist